MAGRRKNEWEPTPEAFDRLLLLLDEDRDAAGIKYVTLRDKLVKYFEWNRVPPSHSEDLADDVFSRVLRKIDEGTQIEQINSYTFAVARFALMEHYKNPPPVGGEEEGESTAAADGSIDHKEIRQQCLDRCLDNFPDEDRELIIEYYAHDEDEKQKARRQQLAARFKINLNALRIRVFKIRKLLEPCVKECCQRAAI
jgi:DNA-directed RNA polymerase specialized sigma24 family protein